MVIDDFDVVVLLDELIDQCGPLSDPVHAVIADQRGERVAATPYRRQHLHIPRPFAGPGPAVDSLRAETAVTVGSIAAAGPWPLFATATADGERRPRHVAPPCPQGEAIGFLDLLRTRAGALGSNEVTEAPSSD